MNASVPIIIMRFIGRIGSSVFLPLLLSVPCCALDEVVDIKPAPAVAQSPAPTVPAVVAEVRPAETSVPSAEVVLAPGDLIRVQVYANDDLDRSLRVGRDSSSFPLVGDIGPLAGLAPNQIEKLLAARLANGFLVRPVVTVTVSEFTPRMVAVIGSVRQALRVPFDPHAPISALQALAQAGGFLDEADQARVMVLRADAIDGNRIERLSMSSNQPEGPASDVTLRPGDTVIVPRFDRAYVMGEVGKPGSVQIESDVPMTVARAISVSGGFMRFARKSKVQLLRDGQTRIIDVDSILAGKSQDDVLLKPGDVVFVPESLF